MKQLLKSIGFGIVLGAVAFFIPFIFKFIFTVMIIGFLLRMIFWGGKRRHFANKYENFSNNFPSIVPIDNQWNKPTVQGNGLVQNINVNY